MISDKLDLSMKGICVYRTFVMLNLAVRFIVFLLRFHCYELLLWTSHAGTVVPECFKDDNANQWKRGKFDPRSLRNP